jgi:hypothetical protein
MKWSPGIRALAYLRRISINLGRIATCMEESASIRNAQWEEEISRRTRKPTPTEIQTLDLEEAERKWQKRQQETSL